MRALRKLGGESVRAYSRLFRGALQGGIAGALSFDGSGLWGPDCKATPSRNNA